MLVATDHWPMNIALLGKGNTMRGEALSEQLRCLVCQSQSIADSDADMAADIRPAMAEATRRAGALGLGPALLTQGEDVVVLADLPEPWRYARVGDLQEADTMAQVLGALRRLHGAEPLGQSFCPFGRIAALAAEARACAAPVPDDFASAPDPAAFGPSRPAS